MAHKSQPSTPERGRKKCTEKENDGRAEVKHLKQVYSVREDGVVEIEERQENLGPEDYFVDSFLSEALPLAVKEAIAGLPPLPTNFSVLDSAKVHIGHKIVLNFTCQVRPDLDSDGGLSGDDSPTFTNNKPHNAEELSWKEQCEMCEETRIAEDVNASSISPSDAGRFRQARTPCLRRRHKCVTPKTRLLPPLDPSTPTDSSLQGRTSVCSLSSVASPCSCQSPSPSLDDGGETWGTQDSPYCQKSMLLLKILQDSQKKQYREPQSYMSLQQCMMGDRLLSIENCYVPPDIAKYDSEGADGLCKIQLKDIFASDSNCSAQPKRILLIGKNGYGKSLFCKKIAFDWSSDNPSLYLSDYYLIFTITLRNLGEKSVEDAVIECAMSTVEKCNGDYTPIDVRSVLNAIQHNVLVLLDGCDEFFAGKEILRSIRFSKRSHWLNNATIVLTSSPIVASKIAKRFQRRLELLEFSPIQIKKYAELYFKNSINKCYAFLKYVTDSHKMSELAKNPLILNLMCLLHENNMLRRLRGGKLKLSDVYKQILLLLTKCKHVDVGGPIRQLWNSACLNLGLHFLQTINIPDAGVRLVPVDTNSFEFYLLTHSGLLREVEDCSSDLYDVAHISFLQFCAAFSLLNIVDMSFLTRMFCYLLVDAKGQCNDSQKKCISYRYWHLDTIFQILTFLKDMIPKQFPSLIKKLKGTFYFHDLIQGYFPHILNPHQSVVNSKKNIDNFVMNLNAADRDPLLWDIFFKVLQNDKYRIQGVRLKWEGLPNSESIQFRRLCKVIEKLPCLEILCIHITANCYDSEDLLKLHCEVILQIYKLNSSSRLVIQLENLLLHPSSESFISWLNQFLQKTDLQDTQRTYFAVTDGKETQYFIVTPIETCSSSLQMVHEWLQRPIKVDGN